MSTDYNSWNPPEINAARCDSFEECTHTHSQIWGGIHFIAYLIWSCCQCEEHHSVVRFYCWIWRLRLSTPEDPTQSFWDRRSSSTFTGQPALWLTEHKVGCVWHVKTNTLLHNLTESNWNLNKSQGNLLTWHKFAQNCPTMWQREYHVSPNTNSGYL